MLLQKSYTLSKMNIYNWSKVEKIFFEKQVIKDQTTRIPYILIDNFPDLGLIVSLRFLEWVFENPEGVISLPTINYIIT